MRSAEQSMKTAFVSLFAKCCFHRLVHAANAASTAVVQGTMAVVRAAAGVSCVKYRQSARRQKFYVTRKKLATGERRIKIMTIQPTLEECRKLANAGSLQMQETTG